MQLRSFFNWLSSRKLYTAVNLFGLAISLMFVILIAEYCYRMLDVDRNHSRRDDIYLLGVKPYDYFTTYPLGTEVAGMFPDIEKKCSILAGIRIAGHHGEKNNLTRFFYTLTDSTLFDFFEYEFVAGTKEHALDSRDKAVITESLAMKLFGTTNVIDREITLEGVETFSVNVSGVIKDLQRTIIDNRTEMFLLVSNYKRIGENDYMRRYTYMIGGLCNKTFLMLRPGTTLDEELDQIAQYFYDNDDGVKNSEVKEAYTIPLCDLMFDKRNEDTGLESTNRTMLIVLLLTGIVILVFAITNYINLTVAQTGSRSKEMACRRLLGESKKGVFLRLISESTILTFIAFIIGLFLALFFEQQAATLIGERLDIIDNLSAGVVAIYLTFIILLGSITGVIPAIALSHYKPIDIVKGTFRYRSKMIFSKIFIFIQYAATIAMLICTSVIYLQIKHLQNAPLGHNTKGIIEICHVKMSNSQYEGLKNELQSLPFVEAVGRSSGSAMFSGFFSNYSFNDTEGNYWCHRVFNPDSTAFQLLGLEILEDYHPASKASYLTPTSAKYFGVKEGQTSFSVWPGHDEHSRVLGGIIKDFRLGSITSQHNHIVLDIVGNEEFENTYFYIYVKITGNEKKALQSVKDLYNKMFDKPAHIIDLGETMIADNFQEEKKILDTVTVFTLIAVLISALGLLALSTYYTRQRIKDIALRKVFGGTSINILTKQFREFARPVMIAAVAAIPASYYVMERWLSTYSYKISQPIWLYAAIILFVLLVGMLTTLSEMVKAVRQNPVEAIKKE